MLKVRNGNYYQQKLQNNYFQPKVLLLAQPLGCVNGKERNDVRSSLSQFITIAVQMVNIKGNLDFDTIQVPLNILT